MPITTSEYLEDRVFMGIFIKLEEFEELVNTHLNRVAGTQEIEIEAINLINNDFDEEFLENFITHVCVWGRRPGIAAHVINQNNPDAIQNAFIAANDILEACGCNVGDALIAINQITYLGQPSFASKHLRFMHPELCPVLDSYIYQRLGYRNDPLGYRQFASDCQSVVASLQEYNVNNPMDREGGQWFVADVEMAIYAYLRF